MSLDMEGIAGTFTWTQEENNRTEVRKCMSQQVEWVLDGICKSRINNKVDEIVIADSHSAGDSLLYEITSIDDRLHLISGFPRPKYMMPAFDNSYNIVFFVGYHGGIGTLKSNMDHSYSQRFHKIWIQDKLMNESLLNAAYAGYYNVPVGLVIGDDSLKNQLIEKDAIPWVKYVITKYSLSRFAVKSRPFNVVKLETIAAVKNLLNSKINDIPLFKFKSPVKLRIELQTASMADVISTIPDIKRIDGVTVELIHDDYGEIFDAIDAVAGLAGSVKW